MTVHLSIGADHGGYLLREALIQDLADYTFIDRGTHSPSSVDYPDYAQRVAQDILSQKASFGVLICTSGIGISIAANKIQGVRAALVYNEDGAYFARLHNDANIICFGQKYITPYLAIQFLKIFVSTSFEGGRHVKRLAKLEPNSLGITQGVPNSLDSAPREQQA